MIWIISIHGQDPLSRCAHGEIRFPDMTTPTTLLAMVAAQPAESWHTLREAYAGSRPRTNAERGKSCASSGQMRLNVDGRVIVARALGMRVAGVSCITNAAAGVTGSALSHAEVLETTNRVSAAFESLVTEFVARSTASQLSSAR